jgi:hypothetical protein
MSTVPIFAPNGDPGDIPFEQLAAAVKAGAKPGIHITAPDGSPGTVPADQMADAVKAGAKIIPIEQQPQGVPEFYGFTPGNVARNAWSGFKGTIAGVGSLAKDLATNPNWVSGPNSTLQKFVDEPMHQEAAKAVDAFGKGNYTEAFGHAVASGLPLAGPAAAQIGEQAGSGDVGGAAGKAGGIVLGGEALNVGAKAVKAGIGAAVDAIKASPKAAVTAPVRLASRAAETAINQKLVPLRPLANIMAPADAAEGVQFKVPGRDYGLDVPAKAQPELDATGENKPFAGGTDEPPTPKPLDATGENKPFAGGMDEPRTPKSAIATKPAPKPAAAPARSVVVDPTTGRPEFSDVVATKQPAAAAAPPASPAAAVAAPSRAAAPAAAPAGNDLLSRLSAIAQKIEKEAPVEKGDAGDLTQLLQDSLTPENIAKFKARKAAATSGTSPIDAIQPQPGGVATTAAPADLVKRWGVDRNSIADTDANLRGKTPQQSQAYIDQLANAYKQGRPVEPVLETRDAQNNITEVDGRHRALAAQQAGVERIPVIVRRLGVQ